MQGQLLEGLALGVGQTGHGLQLDESLRFTNIEHTSDSACATTTNLGAHGVALVGESSQCINRVDVHGVQDVVILAQAHGRFERCRIESAIQLQSRKHAL